MAAMALNAYKIVDDKEYYRSSTKNDMIIGVSNDDTVNFLLIIISYLLLFVKAYYL